MSNVDVLPVYAIRLTPELQLAYECLKKDKYVEGRGVDTAIFRKAMQTLLVQEGYIDINTNTNTDAEDN